MKTPLQIALVGAWHAHARMFTKNIVDTFGADANFKYVWEKDPDRGAPYAEKLGAVLTDDYEKILSDPEVGLIMIEAETCLHPSLILKAAQAGKAVYTDKVLAKTVAEGLEIKRAVERAGVKFCVSHESLPNGAYQYAKRLLTEGALGDVVAVNFRRAHGLAKQNRLSPDWFNPEIAGGGALIDLGVHGLSMLPYFAGEPKFITGATRNFSGQLSEDSATILVEFENGALGTAHTDMVTSIMENTFEIVGTEGVLVVLGWRGQERVFLNSTRVAGCEREMVEMGRDVIGPDDEPPVCQFIRLLRNENDPRLSLPGFDLEMGLTVTRLAEAAYQSAREGRKIPFDRCW